VGGVAFVRELWNPKWWSPTAAAVRVLTMTKCTWVHAGGVDSVQIGFPYQLRDRLWDWLRTDAEPPARSSSASPDRAMSRTDAPEDPFAPGRRAYAGQSERDMRGSRLLLPSGVGDGKRPPLTPGIQFALERLLWNPELSGFKGSAILPVCACPAIGTGVAVVLLLWSSIPDYQLRHLAEKGHA